MRKVYLLGLSFFLFASAFSQQELADSSWKTVYRESYPRTNDLVHTKLEVRFDYDKAYMYGKAWVTLKPHFYATDSLLLDAKGMEILKLALVTKSGMKPLKFENTGLQLNIHLDKSYAGGEEYTIYVDYISKPNEVKVKGSAAINDAKGL